MDELNRYAVIREHMPREFVLLQGKGCFWRKCAFCDYHLDTSSDPLHVNLPILECITGEYGVLDVINSGSCFELDQETMSILIKIVQEKRIHTLWFEAHWMYHTRLQEFAEQFSDVNVKFRTGVETFDSRLREQWQKGIPKAVSPEDIAQYFQGVCLLFGIQGQTPDMISRDIELALKYFDYFSINAFVENTTGLKRDEVLIRWFRENWEETLSKEENVEILIQNTDLGVG